MHDYRFSPGRAFYGVPLAGAFLLLLAARDRRGDDSLPSFADHHVIEARREARAALEEAFRIIPTPPTA